MTHDVWLEGNFGNITQTIPIDISIKPGIIEHVHIRVTCSLDDIKTYTRLFQEFHDVFAWSYEEMLGIDPSIVVHERLTYLTRSPFTNNSTQCTLGRLPLSRVELKNFSKLDSSIPSCL